MIKFALAGLGIAGKKHLAAFRRFKDKKSSDVQLVAVIDPKEDVLAKCEDIKHRFTSWEQFLSSADNLDIDAVVIATPTYMHADMSIQALSRDLHVLCEKPMAMTAEECAKIRASVFPYRFMVSQQHRFNPIVRYMKESMDTIGKLVSIDINAYWNRGDDYFNGIRGTKKFDGGGCLFNQGSHFVDMSLYLAKSQLPLPRPILQNMSAKLIRTRSFIDVEDFADVSYLLLGEKFNNDIVSLFHLQITTASKCWNPTTVRILGTKGEFIATPADDDPLLLHVSETGKRSAVENLPSVDPFEEQLRHFSFLIQDEKMEPITPIAESEIVVETISSIYNGNPIIGVGV